MDIGNCVPGADRRPPVLLATALAALLWSAAAFAQTPSSCALFGPKQAAELDWTARQTPVPIVDKVLADRLRACFGNEPSEPILRSDLHRLRSLRHQGDHMYAIVRLDGLELAVNLQELLLPDNQIADIRPLSGLTALTNLDLARNQVADASPLADYAGHGPDATVNLVGNPLSRASLNEALPRVAQHGVGLEFDRPKVLLFPDGDAEGLLRIINHSPDGGEVEIVGYTGRSSRIDEFELGGGEAVNFNTADLTAGNSDKGFFFGFPEIPDRMEFRTDLDIEVLVYGRGGNGLLTALHDAAPLRAGLSRLDTVNPGSNRNQASVVWLPRQDWVPYTERLLLRAYDDTDERREVLVPARSEPNRFSAAELEESGLGDGAGKWRIEVATKGAYRAWSLLETPGGDLSNLSTRPHRLEAPLFPAGDGRREGFARVANHSYADGTVRIFAVDDSGSAGDPVEVALAARRTLHFNSRDLEAGNLRKGISGGTGPGAGDWRLRFESDLDIVALTYVRHVDGFVSSMHDVAPNGLGLHRVATFGPASNGPRSLLRIVNAGNAAAEVAVSGSDDLGRPGASVVRLVVPAGAATTLTAEQLEAGGPELSGRLGDGEGMWRLSVESAEPLRVMSLMEDDGRLTNVSTAMRGPPRDADGDGVPDHADVDDDNDGIADLWDALPLDPAESVDTDADGIGNLADVDDDGDGVEDAFDARPLDASEHAPPNVADLHQYRFVGEHDADRAFASTLVADVNCDGAQEVIIGAPEHLGGEHHDSLVSPGAIYLVSASDLSAADAADGQADGTVHLGRVAAQPGSWKLIGGREGDWNELNRRMHYLGTSVAAVGDINGDGCADLLVGGRAYDGFAGSAYLVSALDLPAADAADFGGVDGVVHIRRLVEQPGSYEFTGERAGDNAGVAVTGVPDWDGDGFDELVVGASWHSATDGVGEDGDRRGAAYLLARRDLAVMDAADGTVDGSIALSIAPGLRSRRIIGAPGDGVGYFLATGEFDGDGQPDLAIGGTPGALYLLAAADIPHLDAADGAEDGTVDLGRAELGDASWRLGGSDDATQDVRWRIQDLSIGDVDGDGIDDVVVSGSLGESWAADASFPSYVIPASALDAADRADGARDRAARLELAAEQQGALVLAPESERGFRTTVADIDDDGLDDVLFADGAALDGGCGVPRSQGAAWLVSGSYLKELDAAELAIVPAELEPDGVRLWKFVGTGGERLGYGKPLASDLDGDGALDLIIGSYGPSTYFLACGSLMGPGTAVAMSTSLLGEADASDGSADGVIHFDSLVGDYNAVIEGSREVATTQFDDNLVLMELSGETNALLRHGVPPDRLARKLYDVYEDAFDYLVFLANIPNVRGARTCAWYSTVGNSVAGTGVAMWDRQPYFGSAGKLTGTAWIEDHGCLGYDTLAHEIMHGWANFVLPSPGSGPHWGFSSANGLLGGFDQSKLVDLGDGRYAAGSFSNVIGANKPYSPIELYLAGLLPADEVPAIQVASNGRWTGRSDAEHGRIFTASRFDDWSVERIIEEYGSRTPAVADSQRAFRAAFVAVADLEHPFEQQTLEELSAWLRGFSNPAKDADDETFNFFEATGGRATFATDELTRWRKPGAAALLGAGARAVDIRPLAASRSSRPLVVRQGAPRFGRTSKADARLFCGTEHLGHEPWASSAFGGVDGAPRQFVGVEDSPGPYPKRP